MNAMKIQTKQLIHFLLFGLLIYFSINVRAQNDWRNSRNGLPIYSNGYCDQPYVVVLPDGKWLCVFTTNTGHEGSGGQHIVCCTSDDQGEEWTDTVQIEPPQKESASWAMPYLTKYGRVYVFYMYNGDRIHELKGKQIREDMLGWYCFKYSDDNGKSWSERYRLNVPKTSIDLKNDWGGDVQIMWGIGKPIDVGNGMMFAFTKIGEYLLDDSEGWFCSCNNINTEKDIGKLNWVFSPDSEHGLRNKTLGPINSEQNIVQMNNGQLYCIYRTISGHPAESYSNDGGRSWTLPQIPLYENDIQIKNPRACARIWKCKNGKYLLWHHNHGGWNFNSRNPAWISGGIEKDGKIIWGQPEILLYEDSINARMSYPDLIEQGGKYWITETNKEEARCHEIPNDFLEKLWSSFDKEILSNEILYAEWSEEDLIPNSTLENPSNSGTKFQRGFTINMKIQLGDLASNQLILSSISGNGKLIELRTADYGSVKIILRDGFDITEWNSDPGLMNAYGQHNVAVIVDKESRTIQFVVDGKLCNGRDFRQYGWTHFDTNIDWIDFKRIQIGNLLAGQLRPKGRLTNLRIYDSPLMNAEIISIHRQSEGGNLFFGN